MIKNAGRALVGNDPDTLDEIGEVLEAFEAQSAEEELKHLQSLIAFLEKSVSNLAEDIHSLDEDQVGELKEIQKGLDLNRLKMRFITDTLLGGDVLAKAYLDDEELVEAFKNVPSERPAWGARPPSDPELLTKAPTQPFIGIASKNGMTEELIKIATELDNRGLVKEADVLDGAIKKMLKKSAGRKVVETIGSVKIYKDSDWGEYIVVPKGGSVDDDGYHTDDLEDAVDTARHMDSEGDQRSLRG